MCSSDLYEYLLELFLAAILVKCDRDLGSVFGQRPKRLKCLTQAMLKTTTDFTGPAHIECLFLGIELNAGLFAFHALHFGDAVDFEIVKPRAQ